MCLQLRPRGISSKSQSDCSLLMRPHPNHCATYCPELYCGVGAGDEGFKPDYISGMQQIEQRESLRSDQVCGNGMKALKRNQVNSYKESENHAKVMGF